MYQAQPRSASSRGGPPPANPSPVHRQHGFVVASSPPPSTSGSKREQPISPTSPSSPLTRQFVNPLMLHTTLSGPASTSGGLLHSPYGTPEVDLMGETLASMMPDSTSSGADGSGSGHPYHHFDPNQHFGRYTPSGADLHSPSQPHHAPTSVRMRPSSSMPHPISAIPRYYDPRYHAAGGGDIYSPASGSGLFERLWHDF